MDRNSRIMSVSSGLRIVALRKESVDRNHLPKKNRPSVGRSLSARRAWIEIITEMAGPERPGVALRKESVDRNTSIVGVLATLVTVALRKESVDRNSTGPASSRACISRSPQGERG